jgi:hypothetical protein
MPNSRLIRSSACFAMLFSLTHCTSDKPASSSSTCAADDPNCATAGGNTGTMTSSSSTAAGGKTTSGSTTATGGNGTSAGGSKSSGSTATSSAATTGGSSAKDTSSTAGGSTSSVTSNAAGGSSNKSGASTAGGSSAKTSSVAVGGNSSTVGTTTAAGGSTAKGGTSSTVGATTAAGGSTAKGGTSSATGGAVATGGTTSTSTTSAAGGARVDSSGVALASPGDKKTGSREYLNLGDFRLLNNRWGSDELGCSGTTMSVFVNTDKSVGWDFNRPTCGGEGKKPDYPEIEFGIHPFGIGSSLQTSPPFSSTTLLPLQVKDITSASITIDSMNIGLQNSKSWNMSWELWLSQRNPITDPNPGVYAEIIAFWGWESTRWACDTTISGSVSSGGKNYKLCHKVDDWADGQWRYIQYWVEGGPMQNFSGKVDVKAFLDAAVKNWGYSTDFWVTRFEVGSEIDDQTSGKVTIKNISFEVNGTTKGIELVSK